MEDNRALPPSMLAPLCMLKSSYNHRQSSSNDHHRQLALVDPTAINTARSRFRVPDHWVVQEVPRLNGHSRIDKYYYEPESGKRFRSPKDVERYLNGEVYIPKQKALKLGNNVNTSCPWKMIVSGGKMLKLDEEGSNQLQLAVVPTTTSATLHFKLPDGWIVEGVPRKIGSQIDKYYYEPGTGRQFRSLVSVERYLEEVKENAPLSESFKFDHIAKTSTFPTKNNIRDKVKTSTSNSADPPLKVNWVLADPGGDSWSAFMGESEVPDYVRHEWAARFIASMDDRNYKVSNLE